MDLCALHVCKSLWKPEMSYTIAGTESRSFARAEHTSNH